MLPLCFPLVEIRADLLRFNFWRKQRPTLQAPDQRMQLRPSPHPSTRGRNTNVLLLGNLLNRAHFNGTDRLPRSIPILQQKIPCSSPCCIPGLTELGCIG